MKKIRALAIAPYEGLRNMIEIIAQTRQDIEITTYLGNLELGVDIVQGVDQSKYDVIISRGGTAKMIKEATDLPVIEIMLSHYDVLNCIKLAENYTGRFAIIGFPSITGFARVLCDILQMDIKIVTINNGTETPNEIIKLKDAGYSMILGDTIAVDTAKEMNMNAMLITSNIQSIEDAIEQAVNLSSYYINIINQNQFYHAAMEAEHKRVIVYSVATGALLFSDIDDSQAGFLGLTRKLISDMKRHGEHDSIQKVGKEHYHIKGFKAEVKKNTVIIFVIRKTEFYSQSGIDGIKAIIQAEVISDYFSLLYNSQSHREIKTAITQYGRSSKPVLIIGEIGTGKDEAAQIIFRESAFSRQTLYMVDFLMLDDKGWHYLLDNPFSYFMDNNNTFYFKNILLLREDKLNHLFSFIENTKLDKRNRLIFALQYNNQDVKELPLYQTIQARLGCLTIHLPPLREQRSDIPSLISLFLNEYNSLNATQISGCEPEGMGLLQDFDWEYNLNQFKRVISELATTATGPFITTENIRRVLKEESRSIQVNKSRVPGISFDKTLEEIVYDVANEVLKHEKMNQTKTAKKLGISRTTLWRILNKK